MAERQQFLQHDRDLLAVGRRQQIQPGRGLGDAEAGRIPKIGRPTSEIPAMISGKQVMKWPINPVFSAGRGTFRPARR
jgi:hypothetical protein